MIYFRFCYLFHCLQVRFDDKKASWLSDSTDGKDSVLYLLGVLAVGCATLTSGFAGVYNEKVLKNGQQPMLFVRTFQLSKKFMNHFIG